MELEPRGQIMKRLIAVPVEDGKACAHFGRCEAFAIVEVASHYVEGQATASQSVVGQSELTPPAHQPGAYPRFLAEAGVTVVIAGGMGGKARDLFRENNIAVHTGVGLDDPRHLVEQFLRNELKTGDNLCSHGEGDAHGHHCGH
jgi:predicted Fe-Mo cluster-binding NifX family protein